MNRIGVLMGVSLAALALAYGVGTMTPRTPPRIVVAAAALDEALEVPHHVRAILAGGGPTPDLNQVSLEDDVALAASVIGRDESVVLFAGGPGTRAVQERDPDPQGDDVVFALGNLFSPRGGRDAHYRRTRLSLHGGATLDELFASLEIALPDGEQPLFVYFTGHGNGGRRPSDSLVDTWGGAGFDAQALAEELEDTGTSRRVRFVITSCYSGGLAEIAFRGGDPELGATDQDRCGFFSSSWDRESGGCDSDPNRGIHEGFGVHFFEALRGRDRDGRDAHEAIDLDHDGVFSMLEAMAHVRIASRAIDVPLTTSERLVRVLAPHDGAMADVDLPEERAVVDALLAQLGLGSVDAARVSLLALEDRQTENEDALAEDYAEAQDRAADVAGTILSRWPVLDDPYHPDYPAMLRESHDALRTYFDSDEVMAWSDAEDDAAALETTSDGLEVQRAVHLRILQAQDTIDGARRLAALGGEDWEAFERMRACEASAP